MSKKYSLIASLIVLAAIGAILVSSRQDRAKARAAAFSLPIPFTTQAPDNNWENNENCEEASAIMANAYLTGNTAEHLPPDAVKQNIAMLIAWEQQNLGHNINTGAAETGRIIASVYGWKTKVIVDYTEEDLKRALSDNQVVILPIDAQKLDNPKYQDTGRLYHVVVVRGWNPEGFIVHDPGLESGVSNVYSFAVLQQAAADWDSSANKMDAGKKAAVLVSK